MTHHKIKVSINGTTENPWHRFGLARNPFPQIARYEWMVGQDALASLDEPVSSADEIRGRLQGRVSVELVELCVAQYRPGEHVTFDITFEE
jgi:hypothetical protein